MSVFNLPHQRYRRLAAVAGLASALLLSACSTASESESAPSEKTGELSLNLNVYSRELPYFQQIVKGTQTAAKEDGDVKVDVTYGEVDPEMQYSQIENALSSTPDGILVVPMDAGSLVPVLQQAATSGVPVVTVANDLVKDGQDAQTAHVGADYVGVGRTKAQYLVDALKGKGKIGYVHAIRGNSFTEGQDTGATAVFDKNPGIQVIDAGYAGAFSSDAGLASTENALAANPDLDAIFFDNDDLALGGITAIQQRRIADDQILVVGGDGTPAALDAVGDGSMDMTISLCGYITGLKSTQLMLDYLRDGKKPSERVLDIPSLEITADTLDDARSQISAGKC